MKGKWAEGIEPRNFVWVIKDSLAVCERPGGYGEHHRRVRRQEEIIWVRQNHFDVLYSLIAGSHNLHNYEELGMPFRHRPWPAHDQLAQYMEVLFTEIQGAMTAGLQVLVHKEEVGERLCGLMAAYLLWAGLVQTGPQVTALAERIFQQRLGPHGRELVEIAVGMEHQQEDTGK